MKWSHIYAHDAQGHRTAGDLASLIDVVRHGSPVRVFIDYAHHGPGCYKDAQAVWIKHGHVYGQNSATISCCFQPSYVNGDTATVSLPGYEPDGLRFLDDAYHYFEIFSTTGDVDMSRWNIGEHKLRRRDQEKFALTWFAQR